MSEAGIEPSVGSVGDSDDNALAESINGPFTAEVIHHRGPWRSFESVEYAPLEGVARFKNRRFLEPIGTIAPDEAEANFYAALETEPMAAQQTEISRRQTRRGSCTCCAKNPRIAAVQSAQPSSIFEKNSLLRKFLLVSLVANGRQRRGDCHGSS